MKILNYIPSTSQYELGRFDLEIDPTFFKEPMLLSRLRLKRSQRGMIYFKEPVYTNSPSTDLQKEWTNYYAFGPHDRRALEEVLFPLLEPYASGDSNNAADGGGLPVDF